MLTLIALFLVIALIVVACQQEDTTGRKVCRVFLVVVGCIVGFNLLIILVALI